MADDIELLVLTQVAPLAVPVGATPTSTLTNGSATTGTTETLDTVLGVYQVSLIAGRRYLATMNGLGISGTAASDVYRLNIRNSGSTSTPTASSTLVASTQYIIPAAGGSGQQTVPVGQSFLAPATGINTFAFFAVRISGSGTAQPISLNGIARELLVMYYGVV